MESENVGVREHSNGRRLDVLRTSTEIVRLVA